MEMFLRVGKLEKIAEVKIRPMRYGNTSTTTSIIGVVEKVKIRPMRYGNLLKT